MTENVPIWVKEKDTQIQEEQRVPNKMNPKSPTPRHIIIQRQNLKSSKRKKVTYKGTPINLSANLSTKTFQARRESHEIFKVMKNKDLQPRLIY